MPMRSRDRTTLPKRSPVLTIAWVVAAVAVPYGLFLASLNSDFYIMTSPPDWSAHVVLRKVYSVGAFALVGYLIARALRECGRPLVPRSIVILGALYSGAIEVTQYLQGSQEGIWWNLFDVGCGALGGAIAARVPGSAATSARPEKSADRFARSRARRRFASAVPPREPGPRPRRSP